MTRSNIHARGLWPGLVLAFVCTAAVVNAQREEEFKLGVVIDKVVSAADQTKSYALYLPTTYTTTRRFPVLYCFDPVARGAVPVARFKEAAEKYEYIVVGSNNSRNGPNQPLIEIVRNLWEDTHTRFSIDDRRVYLTGMSGGARVALGVGFWLKDKVAGVIACAAGYPPDIPASTPRSFVLLAVTGTDDFNNPELQTLVRKLQGSTPPVRLAVFEGGHTWLPVEVATDALQWLEVQAMKAGIRERNANLINDMFEHASSQALAAQASGDRYRAFRIYSGMVQDFSGLHEVAEVESKAKELGATKEVSDALKQEKKIEEEQARRIQSIHLLIGNLSRTDEEFDHLAVLKGELRSQRDAAKATEPSVKRTVARRIIESLFIEFIERGNLAIARKDYEGAATAYSMCAEIQPDNARTFYNLARAHALAGSRNKALAALRTAAEKGFTGAQELTTRDFDTIQTDKRFNEILELVRKNQSGQQ